MRELALDRLRKQIAIAFDDDPGAARTDRLARFALAAFDGAFVAWQTDPRRDARAAARATSRRAGRRAPLAEVSVSAAV